MPCIVTVMVTGRGKKPKVAAPPRKKRPRPIYYVREWRIYMMGNNGAPECAQILGIERESYLKKEKFSIFNDEELRLLAPFVGIEASQFRWRPPNDDKRAPPPSLDRMVADQDPDDRDRIIAMVRAYITKH